MSVAIPSLRGAIAVPEWAKNELWRKAQAAPSLDLRFADFKSLVDAVTGTNLVTFSRASGGTYVGSDGLNKTATTNEPRFDHDPTTGESLGLLVEESRTNLITQSEDLTTWATTSATKTYDATVVNPYGTLGAWIGANASGTGLSSRVQPATVSYTAGTAYTDSVFCKAKEVDTVAVFFNSPDFGYKYASNYINLNTGAVGGANPDLITVKPYPNGWYRISFSHTPTASGTSYLLAVAPGSTGDVNNLSGNGADGIYIWGAQGGPGSEPGSYIPTAGSAVTRAADVASISGTNFSSWYRQDEGTVFVNTRPQDLSSASFRSIWEIGSDNSNWIALERNGSYPQRGTVRSQVAGVQQYSLTPNQTASETWNDDLFANVAFAYKENSFANYSPSNYATSSSGLVPSATELKIGPYKGAHFKRLTYWPTRLPNETLQAITQ